MSYIQFLLLHFWNFFNFAKPVSSRLWTGFIRCGMCVVAQWVWHATDDREVGGLNPSGSASKLGQVSLPHFIGVFWMRH